MRKLCLLCLTAAATLGAGGAAAQFHLRPAGNSSFWRARDPLTWAPSQLLEFDTVRNDLGLSKEQVARAEKVRAEVKNRNEEERARLHQRLLKNSQKTLTLAKEEADERIRAIDEVLRPEQRRRLEQIALQVRGPAAFLDPKVQAALKLTDRQKEAVTDILERAHATYRELNREARPEAAQSSRQRMQAKRRQSAAVVMEALARLEAGLTDEQRTIWKGMTGAPAGLEPSFLVTRSGGSPSAPLTAVPVSRAFLWRAAGLSGQLKLSDEQDSRLRAIPDEVRARYRDERARLEQERNEIDRTLASFNRDLEDQVTDALLPVLSVRQWARLRQIEVQMLGLEAWGRPDVLGALKLTGKQKDTIEGIREEVRKNGDHLYRQISQEAAREAPGDYQKQQAAERRRAAELYRETLKRITDRLGPEQRKTWQELTGTPLAVQVEVLLPEMSRGGGWGDVPR
jgi:hypothetical protein